MKIFLDGITVYFPYSYIYPEQYEYMKSLKESLDKGGVGVLEMPTGTGKTVTILSLVLSWIYSVRYGYRPLNLQSVDSKSYDFNAKFKLVYCCRTIGEMEKTIEELKKVWSLILESHPDYSILALSLSSRKILCINEEVNELPTRAIVDSTCRDITQGYNDANVNNDSICPYYIGYEDVQNDLVLSGIFNFDDLKKIGRENGVCPYFLVRRLLPIADVIVFSYQYVLNPSISEVVTSQISSNAIVVFDEAHNIDDVCIESLSVKITKPVLDKAVKNVRYLSQKLITLKEKDMNRLNAEYQTLLSGLDIRPNDSSTSSQISPLPIPLLSKEVREQIIPESIRVSTEFIRLLDGLIDFLKKRMNFDGVLMETQRSFIENLEKSGINVNEHSLKFFGRRINLLIKTLDLKEIHRFIPVGIICEFFTILGTYINEGFKVLFEPSDILHGMRSEATLLLSCLDAELIMKPLCAKYSNVILTSGTLTPLFMLPRIIGVKPLISKSFSMTLSRPSICPLIVTRGDDQTEISTKFGVRDQPDIVRNYANLLLSVVKAVPDGIVCFFPSYRYMESIVSMWNEIGILNNVLKYKLIFIETEDRMESEMAVINYKRACDFGRGAVLLSVARGKVSEGVDFDNHYGRCVILFGIPFLYTESRSLKARLKFMKDRYSIAENDFLSFDAMRMSAQCVGRVLRGKSDYGIMIFADKRFHRHDKKSKLPQWITQFISQSHMNLSTDEAITHIKEFLKNIAQHLDLESQIGVSLLTEDFVNIQNVEEMNLE